MNFQEYIVLPAAIKLLYSKKFISLFLRVNLEPRKLLTRNLLLNTVPALYYGVYLRASTCCCYGLTGRGWGEGLAVEQVVVCTRIVVHPPLRYQYVITEPFL